MTLAAVMCLVASVTVAQSEDDPYFGYKAPNMEAKAGIQVFTKCKKCHSMDPARNTFGPNLRGVYQRPAASLARFEYSEELKKSGIVWDEANLRDWVAGNTWLVRGSRMRHVQITDATERDYLVAFLKSFK